ncbi:hypothetical protein QMK17_17500 [Rhodococcus sp. G-MC3]|uniref:hypothetical protein n=1 Tax=Rhodococcus sp. G-MC3 TaxID=3046209 RepID=UPI0024BA8DDC|nr:hypothetical protein [Rhodococcus sp. G-MC3]MDJ0395123.1 hypothetical protein [Rhodococcus sp. G-MC3]
MASDELTGTERVILLVLMSQAEETSNTRLNELGPELKKDHRERLNRLRLIETDRTKSPMVHSLTDRGWAECARELKSGPPPRATPQARGMYAILGGLQRFLDRQDLRPSDVFRADAQVEAVQPDLAPKTSPVTPMTPPSNESIDARIRTAYTSIAPRRGAWVTLLDVRGALKDIPKPKLDRALGDMYRADDVSLIAEENQKALKESVRGAAITIAGRPVHLIAIEAS